MRKVSVSKRRYKTKDLLIWMGIVGMHYIVFLLLTLFILLIRHYGFNDSFLPDNHEINGLFIYVISIGPLINAILHIVYDEVGSPWTRFAMWCNSSLIFIIIPISLLVL